MSPPRPIVTRLHSHVDLRVMGGPCVRTLAPVTWHGRFPNVVPAGYDSDGGTIPAIFWPAVGHPLSARLLPCYLLHDLELSHGVPWNEATRRLNARIEDTGVHWLRRWCIIAGVTIRGWWRCVRR